jgi:hypothetical protein
VTELRDLGYQRYTGSRLPASRRWRVIMRQQVTGAWRTWWRYKAALGLAAITTAVWGGLMFFLSDHVFRGMGGVGRTFISYADAALPMSVEWYCRVAFYLSLTIGARLLAGDVQSGAFTLYFARSVRPRDYVVGQLAGYGLLVATLAGGLVLLAGLRISLSDSLPEAATRLMLLPKALAISAVITVVYTVVPIGFSALVAGRRNALGVWAAYYLLFGTIVQTLGLLLGGSIAALDLPTAVVTLAFDAFDVSPLFGRRAAWQLSSTVAGIAIAAHVVAAVIVIWYRVVRAQRAGVGGAT